MAATAILPKKVQTRRAFDARALKRDQRNVKSSVALEAKAMGATELNFQKPSWR